MRINIPVNKYQFFSRLDRLYIKFRQTIDLVWMPYEALHDMVSFVMNCRLSPFIPSYKKDTYDLIFYAHTIEKGLSLPQPRPHFGRNNISRVMYLLRRCDPLMVNPAAVKMALGNLQQYIEFHRKKGLESLFLNELNEELLKIVTRFDINPDGGTRNVLLDMKKIAERSHTYAAFLSSRFSCRNFSNAPVLASLLKEVVVTAQNAPSQCNRQSTRIHAYLDKEMIARLLECQGGSSGFAAAVPAVLVVTSDVAAWTSRAERQQAYVDAGLFGMALLYSSHAYGLGSCCLNFAKTNFQEKIFKKIANISTSERVVMLVAIGYLDDENPLATRSTRFQVETVLKLH